MTDEVNASVETEVQETAAPEQAEENVSNEVEADAPQETEQEDTGTDERNEQEEFSSRVQRRMDKLTWQAREAERKAAETAKAFEEYKAAHTPQKEKPRSEDYESHDEYIEALTDFKLEQRLAENEKKSNETRSKQQAEQQRNQVIQDFQAKEQVFAQSSPDYHQTIEQALSNIPKTPETAAITHEIVKSENGPALMYELCKNPSKLRQVYSMNPQFAAMELNELAANLNKEPPKPKQILSDPPKRIKAGSTKTTPSAEKLADPNEYMKWREGQRKRK